MKYSIYSILVMASFVLVPSYAEATIVSVTADGQLYSSSAEPVRNDSIIYAIDERQNILLSEDLAVSTNALGFYTDYPDTNILPAGTLVDSHLFHYAPESGTLTANTTASFSGRILGVMVTGVQLDNQLGNSDFLGIHTWPMVYDYDDAGRRLEMGEGWPGTADTYAILDPFTLSIFMTSQNNRWDQIRVVTESAPVPEPATMLLFSVGLAGFAVVRKKISKT